MYKIYSWTNFCKKKMLSFFIRPYKKIAIFVGITSKIKNYGK